MNDFYNGTLVGITQTLVGHPFDTLKVLKQTSSKIFNYKNTKLLNLYKGISYPLLGSGLYNSIQFGIHEKAYNNGYSHFMSGLYGGLLSVLIINPVDVYKINRQVIRNKPLNPFRGFHVSLIREGFSTGVYFGSYFYLLDLLGGKTTFNAFLSGGIAGMAAWTITYPVDVIKSRIMSYSANSIYDAIKMKGLWMGLEFCLLRAFLVNGCGFVVFNYITK